MIKVAHHINIKPGSIEVDGKSMEIEYKETSNLKSIYKALNLDYPKFYKMDGMSKLGVLAVEILKQNITISPDFEDELGLLFYNSESCKESDEKYWSNVQKGKVNPSLFVYTLPNIVLGEISIKNKWYGESLFCIEENEDQINTLIETWFKLKKVKYCISCKIEYHTDSDYFANLQFHTLKD